MATNIIITRAASQVTETVAPEPLQAYVAMGVGVAFAILLFKPFFSDWSGFKECLVFWLKPDWVSWLQGEGISDWWSELKLGACVVVSVGSGILSYVQLPKWLPGVFGP